MNVLFLTHHFQCPNEPGAPRPWQIATFLRDREHRVTVITSGVHYMTGKRTPAVKGRLWARTDHRKLSIIRTNTLSNHRKSLIRRIISYVIFSGLAFFAGLGGPRPHVVLVGTTPLSLTACAYLLAKMRRAKLVLEERELFPEEAIELGYIKSKAFIWFLEAYQHFFRKRADRIIAVTPGIRQLLLGKGVTERKVDVITNGFDADDAAKSPTYTSEEAKARLNLQSTFVVLYAGGFGQVNELWTLMETAAQLKDRDDIRFLLVGDGEQKPDYQTFCRENNLHNCLFHPAKPKREMSLYFAAADACVQLTPSGELWKSILANKVFDYLGYGCPVVFAGAGDTANLLSSANAGLTVPPEDTRALANAILTLYEDSEFRHTLGQNGEHYIMQNYTRAQLLDKLETLLITVAGQRFNEA